MSQTTSPDLRDVDTTIKAMLTENTGRHMLDSGGAYGRNWEKNQENPPWEKPRIQVSRDYCLKNIYHFLVDETEIQRDVTDSYPVFEDGEFVPELGDRRHLAEFEQDFYEWGSCVVAFIEDVLDQEQGGIYGPGHAHFNTYNHNASITQDFQGTLFDLNGERYVFLQIHGGCDVRGGYTKPRLFRCDWEPAMIVPSELQFWCRNCGYDLAESCMYGRDKDESPVFNEEQGTVQCPECDHELSVN